LNELKVQCEDCCSQISIFKPNKFAAAWISVAVAQPSLKDRDSKTRYQIIKKENCQPKLHHI
jgi:hypothetical protein